MTPMAELISMSEFARRKGVTPQSIHKAIKSNRIGVVHEGSGRPKLDWEIASAQWDRTAIRKHNIAKARSVPEPEPDEAALEEESKSILDDPEDDNLLPDGDDYFTNRGVHEAYKAKLARLEYLEKKGQLIAADDIKYAWGKIIATVKQRVQAIPSKAKVRLPHLTINEMDVLDDLVREALTELSEWSLKNAG